MNARTLRQIAGVAPSLQAGATVVAGKTAVVLIDNQNEYREGPLALPDEAAASSAARRLRVWADRAGITVIHVLHQAPADAGATRDLPGPDGRTIPAATMHAAVLAGLGDWIAEIVDMATVEALQAV